MSSVAARRVDRGGRRLLAELAAYGGVGVAGLASRAVGRAGLVDLIVASLVSTISVAGWVRILVVALAEVGLSVVVGFVGIVLVAGLGGPRWLGFTIGLALTTAFQVLCFVSAVMF